MGRMESHPDLVVVQTFNTKIEAQLAKSALDAAHINAMVAADDAGGLQPALWEGRGVAVVVARDDEQAAREVLTGRPPR